MRIDWQTVASNIFASGRGHAASVARRCGMQSDWLRNIKIGASVEPGFSAGLKLLREHLVLCGKEKHREVIKR